MPGPDTTPIVVGSRGGELAEAMTTELLRQLGRAHPHVVFRRLVVTTVDGRNGKSQVHLPPARRMFTTQLEAALLGGEIDLAVRSLKDVAVTPPPDLALGAVLARADARDALCGSSLRALPHGARVGTGSPRRTAQMLALRPDVKTVRLRGGMAATLQRLRGLTPLDGVVLPVSGLTRLGLEGGISEPLGPEEFPPAPGQGALGVQVRAEDDEVRALLAPVHDETTGAAVTAERALLAGLQGNCAIPIGAHAEVRGDQLRLVGQVTALDGSRFARLETTGPAADAADLGHELATNLLDMGAGRILADIHAPNGPH
jgi:hydroxymethylbilane synthase